MSSFVIEDLGLPITEDQAEGKAPAAPAAFPLPVVMLLFLVIGYFMLRTVWKE